MRRALEALFPGAAVFGLAVGAIALSGGDVRVQEFADTYGSVVYGAGLALSWVFHRSRVFIVLLCLGLVDLGLSDAPDRAALVVVLGTVLIAVIGLLALSRDRGILSRGGVLQMGGAGALASLALIAFAEPEQVRAFAEPFILPFGVVVWPGLPRATIVVCVGAFVAVAYGFHRWGGPVDRAFVWAVLLLMIAMHPEVGAAGSSLFLLAAGLTLTLSVVETSYILAYRDDLTGLPGRRALMQYLDGVKGVYAIAMVDVDHFKKFNDKHGHDVGDQVLQMVASRLARAPGGAKAYRYGGEEFTLLFPGRTREDAFEHLEAVRESVERSTFALRSWKRPAKKPDDGTGARPTRRARTLSVTVSIGVADTAGVDDTAEVALKRSDQALYRAKKKGRNQVSK